MGTLGQYLREAREARGIDLRDAAQQTRISLQYLRALEEEHFSKLPGEVFVKGFLKNYGRFLQLDDAEVMAKYEALKPPKAAPVAGPAPGEGHAAGPVVPEPPHKVVVPIEPFVWAGGVLVLLILFVALIMPTRHPRKLQTTAKTTHEGQVISTPSTTAGKPEKMYLQIVALESTWLLLRTDNSPQKKAVLTKGESLTWTADERFQLSYGSAGALQLTLNGKELTVNEPKNAIVRDMTITAAGIMSRKVQALRGTQGQQKVRQSPLFQQPRAPEPQQAAKPKPLRPAGQQQVTAKPKPAQPSDQHLPLRTRSQMSTASTATTHSTYPQSQPTLTR